MANNKNDKKIARTMKSISDKLDNMDTKMDDIYTNTYSSRNTNRKELDRISNDIYNSVNTILSQNSDINGIPDISRLYTRLKTKNSEENISNTEGIINGAMDIFQDKELLNAISANPEINRYIKSLDEQYDMICKYMPELKHALEIKKDNVLSSDNFTKEFINPVSIGTTNIELFNTRCIELNKKHDINILFEEIYDQTAMYGEYFLYNVPYEKALNRLLDRRSQYNSTSGIRFESATMSLLENGKLHDTLVNGNDLAENENPFKDTNVNITLEFSNGLSNDTLNNYVKAEKLLDKVKGYSLHESFVHEKTTDKPLKLDKNIFSDKLDYGKEFEKSASDGLVDIKNNTDKTGDKISNMLGCLAKKLIHYNVVPIYIEDVCIGYYYLEFGIEGEVTNNIINSSTFPSHNTQNRDNVIDSNETMLRFLSDKISRAIDANFINNNHDLKEEIYVILKYNDTFNINQNNNIKVSFLPAEDVFHFYFRLDEETHHGISDLKESLIPAMFYCLLKLTCTIGNVTRGQDKRIYYVKQNVDTNVSRNLMNVINQIKKGNFGIRQMESMNNILNITGRYNDHVIPVGSNGDSPIQFEVMEGQKIETPTELLDGWKEEAINATSVPLEFINTAMQVDYAMRFTMSNTRFLRMVFKRQLIVESKYSKLYCRMYNYEFGENESLIEISLPAPSFLSTTNGAQLIANAKEYANQIAEMEYTEDGPEKQEFIKLLVRHMLPTYINVTQIEKLKEQAKNNSIILAQPTEEE